MGVRGSTVIETGGLPRDTAMGMGTRRTTMATTTMTTTTMSLHSSTSRNSMRTTTATATHPTEPYPMASLTDMAGVTGTATEEGTLTEEAMATTAVTDTATVVTAVDTTPTSPGMAVPTLLTSADTGLNITKLQVMNLFLMFYVVILDVMG